MHNKEDNFPRPMASICVIKVFTTMTSLMDVDNGQISSAQVQITEGSNEPRI